DGLPAAHVEVHVQPVLGRLPLGHALDEDARPDAIGVLDGIGIVPVLLGDALGLRPRVPVVEALRWRGRPVAEGRLPELTQGAGIGGVEDELEAGHHVGPPSAMDTTPRGRSTQSTTSASTAAASRSLWGS